MDICKDRVTKIENQGKMIFNKLYLFRNTPLV